MKHDDRKRELTTQKLKEKRRKTISEMKAKLKVIKKQIETMEGTVSEIEARRNENEINKAEIKKKDKRILQKKKIEIIQS